MPSSPSRPQPAQALALALYPGVFWPVSAALVANVMGATTANLRSRGSFTTAASTRSAVSPEKKKPKQKKKKKKTTTYSISQGGKASESPVTGLSTDPYGLRTPSPLPRPRRPTHVQIDETRADNLEV